MPNQNLVVLTTLVPPKISVTCAISRKLRNAHLRISVLSQIQSPLPFLKGFRFAAQVERIKFQDPKHKNDFDNYYGRTVFHLPGNLEGNQYLDVLRILGTLQILIPANAFLENLRINPDIHLINFQHLIQNMIFKVILQ